MRPPPADNVNEQTDAEPSANPAQPAVNASQDGPFAYPALLPRVLPTVHLTSPHAYASASRMSSASTVLEVEQGSGTEHHGSSSKLPERVDEDAWRPLLRPRTLDTAEHQRRRKRLCVWFTVGSTIAVVVLVLVIGLVRHSGSAGHVVAGQLGERVVGPQGQGTGSPGFTQPTKSHDFRGRPRRVVSAHGVVAADMGDCSHLGAQVLEEGGNAVDAAVATTLCQGVLNPFASGIGGGLFMSLRYPNGTSQFIDAREVAPAAAHKDMFTGMPSNASLLGGLAVAVPMELKGLELAWRLHGSGVVSWQRLVQPAAALAAQPLRTHPFLQFVLEEQLHHLRVNTRTAQDFLIPDAGVEGGWRAPRTGELCCARPALAHTLQQVAEHGVSWLYTGQVVQQWAADLQAAGGIITAADLQAAQPVVAPLLTMEVGSYQLHVPPLPSAASILGLALRLLQGKPQPSPTAAAAGTVQWWQEGSSATASADQLLFSHWEVESMKEAFALRMGLGDPLGTDANMTSHITRVMEAISDTQFADALRSDIRDDAVLPVEAYGRQFNPYANNTDQPATGHLPTDRGTTHITVVDGAGMAVSLTSTINTHFASCLVSPSTGILMNNEMDDFSKPDAANQYGLAPSAANFIAPGKRPLSSMSPLILTQHAQHAQQGGASQEGTPAQSQVLRMVLGGSGGPRILTAVLQTVARVVLLGWDLWDAVSAPRMHHQLLPNMLRYENFTLPGYLGDMGFHVSKQLTDYLAGKGNVMAAYGDQLGTVQAVYMVPGSETEVGLGPEPGGRAGMLVAVSDPRKDGAPAAVGPA